MADLLRQYIQQQAKEKELRDKRAKGKEKRFTVTLSEYDYRRLRFIAKRLGLLRTALTKNLLIQALNDAEDVLGLKEKNESPNDRLLYGEFTDYGNFINELTEEEDDTSDDEEK